MLLSHTVYGQTFRFSSVKEVLAKANEYKSGDVLARVAAADNRERMAAKLTLAELTVADIRENPVVPYETDEVTRIIQDGLDDAEYRRLRGLTIGELRDKILSDETSGIDLLKMSRGMTSEVIAAVAKLMGNLDLMIASKKIEVTARCNTVIGGNGVFASRLQPNHPTDDIKGILSSLLDGLSYAVGDAVLGVNPAIDSVESTTAVLNLLQDVKTRYAVPTQICVLSHISTQMKALKAGAPTDLFFQSIAGSEKALGSFAASCDMLGEADDLIRKSRTANRLDNTGNYMYFETGQGSELSSDFHHGADQQTMESRCYGLARRYKPFLVNTVVGFIGPEYLYDGRQVIRAAHEDVFCGKMHGLPMGIDCCYTNHMSADQNDIDNLIVLAAAAGASYVMGVPQSDDIMLMYQSTGYHDIAAVRELLGLKPIEPFSAWAENLGILENGRLGKNAGNAAIFKL
ncbi:MAG: ethanolamine ammonia-lyase subunit EutB [Clostridiales bacterium]|jgi:ethanolamine ammonia-lyase large subunit|nr:ethanolamine ammonia-lyase subunit EutB [Clostridiales bacterium]